MGVIFRKLYWGFLCILLLLVYQNCGPMNANQSSSGGLSLGSNRVTFAMIQVTISNHCIRCHQRETSSNSFVSLATYDDMIAAGIIVPGSANSSDFFNVIDDGKMPVSGRIPQEEIDNIRVWIDTGARGPE